MRLCIVTAGDFFSDFGGGQSYVRSIVHAILQQCTKLQVELSILSISPSFELSVAHKNYHGSTLYEIHPQGDLRTLLQNFKPDIVHAHGEKLLTARLCRQLQIPCLITVHHGGLVCPAGALLNSQDQICNCTATQKGCLPCYLRNIRSGRFWYPLLKYLSIKQHLRLGTWLEKKPFIPFLSPIGGAALTIKHKLNNWNELSGIATHFVAPSQAIVEALLRNGVDESKISVLPHGVSQNESTPIPPTPDNTIRFYCLGRICHIKGIHILLQAFSGMPSNNVELHIIGSATGKSDNRYLRKLKHKYCHDSRIYWHGKIAADQMASAISSFHCLIHPAICLEVFGLDMAEALSAGKHVIATRCGGAEMQIADSGKPWLIRPNDPGALRDALIWYLHEGHTQSEKHFVHSMEEHIASLIDLYQKVLHQ